jgi:hypothetical protein
MRSVAAAALVVLVLMPELAIADPEHGLRAGPAAVVSDEVDRFHVGAERHWTPGAFEDWLGLGLGLGWRVPRRWYDADGALLTERSLLHPGRDLERPGLYLALRF